MKLRNKFLALALSAAIMAGGLMPACNAAFSLFKSSSEDAASESTAETTETEQEEEDPDPQAVGVHTFSNVEDFNDEFKRATQITYEIGGTTITIHEEWIDSADEHNDSYPIIWDTTFTLSQPLESIEKLKYGTTFTIPAGTTVTYAGTYTDPSGSSNVTKMEVYGFIATSEGFSDQDSIYDASFTTKAETRYSLNYAGIDSYGVTFLSK